ncbi:MULTISPECIES: DUF975 family protein [Enterococcus]|uniref:DUF975 family protein n=1 Tax=Enterococcus TaxID=1350 RepID=UPI00065E19D0|nr:MULTISPECIES: DUF975 family protein [Enterococcus]KAF1301303.1 hypothetical protein BAU16_09905 [Enterococcus sp. JM9B]
MQKTNPELRKQARERLAGQWGMNVLIVFLSIFASGIVQNIFSGITNFKAESTQATVLDFLVSNLVLFAFTYATYFVALYVVRGGKAEAGQIFVIFNKKYYVPMMIINFLNSVAGYLVGLIVFLPLLVMFGASVYAALVVSNGTNTDAIFQHIFGDNLLLVLLFFLLVLVLLVASSIVTGVFQFAAWAKMDFPDLKVGASLSYGWKLLKGRIGQYILLQLSFIGWYILGMLAFVIGTLWAVTYANVSIAAFYDDSRKQIGDPI